MKDNNFYDRAYLTHLLETSSHYIFAKTMPKNPHFYTLKRNWSRKESFEQAVMLIRSLGKKEYFKGYPYICFYANGWKYWTMGAALEETILINRARVNYKATYDTINVDDYYSFFQQNDEYVKENLEIKERLNIGSIPSARILDIGCGVGLPFSLDSEDFFYNGIDISIKSLKSFKQPKNAKLTHSSFEDYFTTKKYDYIISLFGSPSYINMPFNDMIQKMESMLAFGGRIFLMFYDANYKAVTYSKFGMEGTPNRSDFGNLELVFGKYRIYNSKKD